MARTISRSAAERSNRALFIAALIFAGLAAVLFLVFLLRLSNDSGGTTAVAGDDVVPVAVAAQDIPAGVEVTRDMLDFENVPSGLVIANALQEEGNLVEGQVARSQIYEGDQVSTTKLGDAAIDDSPGSAVPADARVIGVAVEDSASLVGGLLGADDRVDMILVREIEIEGGAQRTEACMAVQAVGVFAVADQFNEAVVQGEQGDEAAASSSSDFEANPEAQSVQLVVSPAQSLNVARAQEDGRVFLSLRENQNEAVDTSLPACY